MNKFIFYGLSAGLNRGGVFLLLPFSALFLSVEEFGLLSVILISAQLLAVVVSGNFSAIIARITLTDIKLSVFFTWIVNISLLIAFFLFFLFLIFFFDRLWVVFLFYVVSEAIYLTNSTFLRFKGGVRDYFILSFSKFFILTFSFLCSYLVFSNAFFGSLDNIVTLLVLSNIVIFPSLLRFVRLDVRRLLRLFKMRRKDVKVLVIFSLTLIPHVMSQWVISSSDRYIVKYMIGSEELGIYSFSYSIAILFMLVNSALALGLPHICVENINRFSSVRFYTILFFCVSSFWVLFFFFIKYAFPFDSFKYPEDQVVDIFYWVMVGMYFLSFYYYFSSFIFYDMKSNFLSGLTLAVAVINVILVVVACRYGDITYVALATFVSYFCYMFGAAIKCGEGRFVFSIPPVLFMSVFYFIFY